VAIGLDLRQKANEASVCHHCRLHARQAYYGCGQLLRCRIDRIRAVD
jgi:hypothetical protein